MALGEGLGWKASDHLTVTACQEWSRSWRESLSAPWARPLTASVRSGFSSTSLPRAAPTTSRPRPACAPRSMPGRWSARSRLWWTATRPCGRRFRRSTAQPCRRVAGRQSFSLVCEDAGGWSEQAAAGSSGRRGLAPVRPGARAAPSRHAADGRPRRAGAPPGHPPHRRRLLVSRHSGARAAGAVPRGGRRRAGAALGSRGWTTRSTSGWRGRRWRTAGARPCWRTGGRRLAGLPTLELATRPAASGGADRPGRQPPASAAGRARGGPARAQPEAARHAVHDAGRRVPGAAGPPHRPGGPGDRRAARRPVPVGARRHGGLLRQPGGAAWRPDRRPHVRGASGAHQGDGARRLRARRLSAAAPRRAPPARAGRQPDAAVPGFVRDAEGDARRRGAHRLRPRRGGGRGGAGGLPAGVALPAPAAGSFRADAPCGGAPGKLEPRAAVQHRPVRRRDRGAPAGPLRPAAAVGRRRARSSRSRRCRSSPRRSATSSSLPGTTPRRPARRRPSTICSRRRPSGRRRRRRWCSTRSG